MDMENRITALEVRLDTILPTLATKADIESVRADLESVKAQIQAQIEKSASETHKWMLGTVIGLFIGFGGLFLATGKAAKAPVSSAQPLPPIVITLPAPALPAAAPPAPPAQ